VKKILKIGQYLTRIWLDFLSHPVELAWRSPFSSAQSKKVNSHY